MIRSEESKAEKEMKDAKKINLKLIKHESILAHDISSPLSVFEYYLEALKKSYNMDPAFQIKYKIMKSKIKEMVDMLETNLMLSKNGLKSLPDPVILDLGMHIEEIFVLDKKVFLTKKISVKNEIQNVVVFAHLILIKQLLTNLLGNAIKHGSDNENPEIKIIKIDQDEKFHTFAVIDNGKGIDLHFAKSAFDLYASEGNGKGLGVGLSSCKWIVELYGGTIWFDTAYKGGSKLCFKLPIG